MKKKLLLISFLIVVVVALACFTGCSNKNHIDMTDKTAVVYQLEGGVYQNCTGKITHYYDLKEDEQTLIYSPKLLSNRDVTKDGYVFGGWYKKRFAVPNEDFCSAFLGETNTAESDDQFVEASYPFEDGKAYYLAINQSILGKMLYFVAENEKVGDNLVGKTTDNLNLATNVYVELTANGYYLYILDGDEAKYISYVIDDSGEILNFEFLDKKTNTWAWDETRNSFRTVETVKLRGKPADYYYLGTMENPEESKFSEVIGLYTNIESVTYDDEWDFAKDKITTEGVTLYAYWASKVKYSYRVCYIDETTGETVVLGTYDVNIKKGTKFSDYNNYAEKRPGYTVLSKHDSEGNIWDPEFTHPGGDEDTCIDVYVKYLKGDFKIVSTADELIKAVSARAYIYLLNDIDCGGKSLKFADYRGTFIGNGHTVSNFTVGYDATINGLDFDSALNASIFGNARNATISDVTFTDVVLDYKSKLSKAQAIIIAPLGSNLENVTITNVKVSGMKIIISEVPDNLIDVETNELSEVHVVTNELYYTADKDCVITGCSVENVTFENNVN